MPQLYNVASSSRLPGSNSLFLSPREMRLFTELTPEDVYLGDDDDVHLLLKGNVSQVNQRSGGAKQHGVDRWTIG